MLPYTSCKLAKCEDKESTKAPNFSRYIYRIVKHSRETPNLPCSYKVTKNTTIVFHTDTCLRKLKLEVCIKERMFKAVCMKVEL